MSFLDFSRREKATVITAVMIGNVLEWYEIYLYVYWAPIISKLFFPFASDVLGLVHTFFIFWLGFLSRPIGGVILGRLGDRIGRKKVLLLSILIMTVPTIIIGILPTYHAIGACAPWILGGMRMLQSFPAGGELPGAFCYLYESSPPATRRFFCCWATMGYQIGILISTLECLLLEKLLPPEDLAAWGWRLSFLVGGLIGFCGLFLRRRLHETPLFKEMATHERVVKDPVITVLSRYKFKILMAVLFCALNSSAFYLFSVNLPAYFVNVLGESHALDLWPTVLFLLFVTIPIPFFGYLGDKLDNKKTLVASTIGMILLLCPIYHGIMDANLWVVGLSILVYGIFFTWLSALIPYIVADLFPTYARFTCAAVSFNIADAAIGGFVPFAALFLLHHGKNPASIIWILLFCSFLSLGGYLSMKSKA